MLLTASVIACACTESSPTKGIEPPAQRPFSVSTFSPTSGDMEGCTAVTMTGVGFTPGMRVVFGDTPSTNVSFVNDTTIVAVAPRHPAGGVLLYVTRPDWRTAAPKEYYQYIDYGDKSPGCWDY